MSLQYIFLDTSQFLFPESEAAQTQLLFTDAFRKIQETFANTDVEVVLEKPASGDYSTVYLTNTFDNSESIIGIAQQDSLLSGNPNDVGMINFNELERVFEEHGLNFDQQTNLLANSVSHEIGHLMGLGHSGNDGLMHDGLIHEMLESRMMFSDDQIYDINDMVQLTTSEDNHSHHDHQVLYEANEDYFTNLGSDATDSDSVDSNNDDYSNFTEIF